MQIVRSVFSLLRLSAENYFAPLLIVLILIGCQPQKNETINPPLSGESLIKRGEYLANMGACHDCHSPKIMTAHGPIPDPSRLMSGHPSGDELPPIVHTDDWVLFSMNATSFVGPWGQSFSANLTPHATGIGRWTIEQFATALRKGKYKGIEGSRDLVPPMPWEMYKHINDEDLNALFAYLKSLKPIENRVPANISAEDLKASIN